MHGDLATLRMAARLLGAYDHVSATGMDEGTREVMGQIDGVPTVLR